MPPELKYLYTLLTSLYDFSPENLMRRAAYGSKAIKKARVIADTYHKTNSTKKYKEP